MVDIDDEIARAQRRGFGEHVLGAALALGYAHQSVAEHVLLADDRQILGLETALQRDHRQRQRASRRALSACGHEETQLLPLQAVFGEHMARRSREPSLQPATTTFRPRSREAPTWRTAASKTLIFSSSRSGREIAADPAAAVEYVRRLRRRLERREPRQPTAASLLGEFVGGEIEPLGRQRPIVGVDRVFLSAARRAAKIIGDLGEARARGILSARVDDERRVADIVE